MLTMLKVKTRETPSEQTTNRFSDLVERLLSKRITPTAFTILLVGEESENFHRLQSELDANPEMQVIGRSQSSFENVLFHLEEFAPDLILFDIGLCVAHHMRTIQVIRSTSPSTRILVLSPDEVPLHIQQFDWCGVDGYVLKNSRPQKILEKIREICRSRPD